MKKSIHDRVVPLPPFFMTWPLNEWPEELYGGRLQVRRAARRRFELLVLLTVGVPAGLAVENPFIGASVLVQVLAGAIWFGCMLRLSLALSLGADGYAQKAAKKNAEKRPDLLPVRLREDYELGRVVNGHLRKLSPDALEVAEQLLKDGYEGTVGDLVEMSRRLTI